MAFISHLLNRSREMFKPWLVAFQQHKTTTIEEKNANVIVCIALFFLHWKSCCYWDFGTQIVLRSVFSSSSSSSPSSSSQYTGNWIGSHLISFRRVQINHLYCICICMPQCVCVCTLYELLQKSFYNFITRELCSGASRKKNLLKSTYKTDDLHECICIEKEKRRQRVSEKERTMYFEMVVR